MSSEHTEMRRDDLMRVVIAMVGVGGDGGDVGVEGMRVIFVPPGLRF